ncbi:MAG: MBOAT family O-acyltransferase [Chitinophagaceae bacterium]
MLFNSVDFAFFLPVVYALYWFACRRQVRIQNILLLIASYYFYGSWDPRFLLLLAFSTFLDYFTGLKISDAQNQNAKKIWLCISVVTNVGFLAFFKYYNFFAESFASLLGTFGLQAHFPVLQIILPVGISFYTFHGLSYVFDIYRGKINPTRNVVDYSLFVSFFPLLVAGPIERATHLLPQVAQPRRWNTEKAADGLRQILWGLFKKVLIADNCAQYSSMVFNHYQQYDGGALLVAAICFMFEVYGDFSGYSDIALGTARLFGIELLQNFSYPYFSRSISEFWTRWHISLSSWFRDYVYIPLGGGREGKWKKARNVFVVFLLSGFWHGASFNRIFWGGLHGFFMLPGIFLGWDKKTDSHIVAAGKLFPSLKDLLSIIATFLLCTLALIVFRTTSLHDAGNYLKTIARATLSGDIFKQALLFWHTSVGMTLLGLLSVLIATEWLNRTQRYALEAIPQQMPRIVRWLIYLLILAALFLFANRSRQFIYFQF